MTDGRIKLYVTHRSLAARRDHPGLFSAGDYIPLAAEGPKAAHAFAFARRAGEAAAVVAVPRLVAGLSPDPARPPLGAESWPDTRLPLDGLDPALRWRNAFTGEVLTPRDVGGRPTLAAADLFAHFPVALLLAERGG
jgi:(1->4)-alpha-D-glucan 1-alpha-D-glucosylmutase